MIRTRLTERYDLKYPIFSAPMALAAGGRLAAAVSNAGGLGFIGGSYGDPDWMDAQFAAAGNTAVGFGFITWKLAQQPERLDQALAHAPRALFLSFDDPSPFVGKIRAVGLPLICQVQTLRDAKIAAECGADVIIAQGAEAGGHGEKRATMTLVPEVVDYLAARFPEILLLAAGGIADGRGLAAALMLGADGALVGSRLWASEEALVHPNMLDAALAASGDDTIQSSVMDVARRLDWPKRYAARVLKNAFTDRWHDDLDGLIAAAEVEVPRWKAAWEAGDVTVANTFIGEAAGLISDIKPAAVILENMVAEAEALIGRGTDWVD